MSTPQVAARSRVMVRLVLEGMDSNREIKHALAKNDQACGIVSLGEPPWCITLPSIT